MREFYSVKDMVKIVYKKDNISIPPLAVTNEEGGKNVQGDVEMDRGRNTYYSDPIHRGDVA